MPEADAASDLLYGTEEEKFRATVWGKADAIPREDASYVRQDMLGNTIRYSHYGSRDSDEGWEFHHIIAKSKGGGDELDNLIPLQWRENVRVGDDMII